ncbi:hypothetical protein JJB07_00550 [Tumebacillus sp. ITR2]|uniref:Uncharacterized protein n=1 Tax=Tumebacillus amylolyticus TaxID=2801339 RepID=A0ABS1J4C1_9BACL|nr:hypothetical protein [Tumebacillus amylolyticus]MBL0385120.1 hypothetical protein [Tumebacillus amylolyticus]
MSGLSGKTAMIEEILQRLEDHVKLERVPGYNLLFAKMGTQGCFLIYDEETGLGDFDMPAFTEMHKEARLAGLKSPYNVFARYEVFQSKSVHFHKVVIRKVDS